MDDNALLALASMLATTARGPQGASDISILMGTIIQWDDLSSPPTNQVLVNGGIVSNLRTLAAGVGTAYKSGDQVLILRRTSQMAIMGKITLSGGSDMSRPASDYKFGGNVGTAGSFRDLDAGGSSPVVTVRVPTGGNCMVFYGSAITSNNSRLEIGPDVTGASTIPAGTFPDSSMWAGQNNAANGGPTLYSTVMGMYNYKDGVGISPAIFHAGVNTFALKYRLATFNNGTAAQPISPWIFAFPY